MVRNNEQLFLIPLLCASYDFINTLLPTRTGYLQLKQASLP